LSAKIACRISSGSSCTVPPASVFVGMHIFYSNIG
jgi:hypothetical protein